MCLLCSHATLFPHHCQRQHVHPVSVLIIKPRDILGANVVVADNCSTSKSRCRSLLRTCRRAIPREHTSCSDETLMGHSRSPLGTDQSKVQTQRVNTPLSISIPINHIEIRVARKLGDGGTL